MFGRIVEIRDGADKVTDNKTPDIYCEFDPPLCPKDIEELEKRFSDLYKAPKKLDDITLDSVIMAPDMIKSLTEKTDGRKITIYSLEEDWAYDDDYGHTTEIFLDYMLAKKKLCEKIKNEKEDGSVERWLDDDELIEDYGNDYYEAYLDGYYSSSHYLVDITSHSVSVNDSVVSDFANAYINNSRVEDFVSQIEQWDEVEKMTDKQYNCKTSPVTIETKVIAFHFQLVDRYIHFLLDERIFGTKTDENGKKKRKTASDSLKNVFSDAEKQFSYFNPKGQNDYKDRIVRMINTFLCAWVQYRETFIEIKEA